VGQAVWPAVCDARIPKKIASFSPNGRLSFPDLAPLGIPSRGSGFYFVRHSRSCLRGPRSSLRSARRGTALAKGESGRRPGLQGYLNRRQREALLSTSCLGSDAKPRAYPDSPSGRAAGADEMAERLDGQGRKPNPEQDRASVLAGRELRSLLAQFESNRQDDSLYRAEPVSAGLARSAEGWRWSSAGWQATAPAPPSLSVL
jgi:hypothetical protein